MVPLALRLNGQACCHALAAWFGAAGCERLQCSPARQQIEDKNDDGENQQKVDPAAEGVTAHEAENPKNYKDDGDRPKHMTRAPKFRAA